jgi:eukaryotic-like serine/threonine-protein kinase
MNRRGGRVEEPMITKWAIQACDVLAYIHSLDPPIIYRDLKPANLMLDEKKGKIMLIDFGIARFVAPTVKGVTAIGTMGYAPPELFAGKVEPRSDIYSLGATMFHMLTGSDPQDNPLLIFDFSKHPRPRQINSAITPEMDAILCKMVAHKPEDRHASAAELKKAFEEHERRLTAPVSAPVCASCGGTVHVDDAFCAHCGASHPGRPASGPVAISLTTLDTNYAVQTFRLDKENNLIGRADPHAQIYPEVDLTAHDPQTKVSRRHARVYRQGNQYFIEDLSSANGTFVNGTVHLQPKIPHALHNGDVVKLGETMLKVSLA